MAFIPTKAMSRAPNPPDAPFPSSAVHNASAVSTPNHTPPPNSLTSPSSPEPPSTSSRSTPTLMPAPAPSARPPARISQSFVMNKVEKEWILRSLIAHGAPLQKMKTLDATCAKVAESAKIRHVPDSAVVYEQNAYGMCWRRDYMSRITAENIRHIANTVPDMAKKVILAAARGEEEDDGPVAAARGVENDAQHALDQAVLDYKHEASKRTLTTDDDASRAFARNRESRAEKEKRNRERKETFEKNKRRREELQKARERRRMAAELQNLPAQTRIANAASASASLQRRQSEQFGILVGLFAQNNKLPLIQPSTPLPPPLPAEPLLIDPNLVAVSEQGTDINAFRTSSEVRALPSCNQDLDGQEDPDEKV